MLQQKGQKAQSAREKSQGGCLFRVYFDVIPGP